MTGLRSRLTVLSEEEVETIHTSSLRILERVGFRAPLEDCLKLASEMGAIVDRASFTVRIPERVMEDVLGGIRRRATAADDHGPLRKLEGWIATEVYLVDSHSNTRRLGLLDDVKKGIALAQRLGNIPRANAIVVPSDVPPALTDIASFQRIYAYSRKDGGTFVLSPFSAKYITSMARVMGRRVPYLLDTVSPLQFRKESLEIALVFAQEGQPITISPMVMAGGTGPVTLAGALVLENAEALASLFLIYGLTQTVAPYTAIPHSMDLRTTLCSFGSPNQALFGICVAQMARRYGLVPECNAGLTDALRPDFQAGFEKAATAVFSCLAGVRAIGAQGIAGSDQGFSFEQLVIDNEWLEAFNYILGGVKVTEETIAEDLIASVGIGGSYFAAEHTAAHLRTSNFYSKLFNRDDWEAWQKRGSKDVLAKAHEYVESATAGYREMEPVCTPGEYAALQEIVRCAEEEAAQQVLRR